MRLSGYLFSLAEDSEAEIDNEYHAAQRAGVAIAKLDRVPDISFDTGACIEFKNLAQFHPIKYLEGLANAITKHGGKIFCSTQATDISSKGYDHSVITSGGRIYAPAVVVATNTPFNKTSTTVHTKQAAYLTYVIGVRVPKGSVPRILLWDTGDPYYYVRLAEDDNQPDHDILVVGGVDHKVGEDKHPQDRYDEIENGCAIDSQWRCPWITDGLVKSWSRWMDWLIWAEAR